MQNVNFMAFIVLSLIKNISRFLEQHKNNTLGIFEKLEI